MDEKKQQLYGQLKELVARRSSLEQELQNTITTIHKVEGALELIQVLEEEEKKKKAEEKKEKK